MSTGELDALVAVRELRPLDMGTPLGLSFDLPRTPRDGAPFVLNRRDTAR